MHRRFVAVAAAALLFVGPGASPREPETAKALTAEDRESLEKLLREFLFDPRGTERVRVKAVWRTAWGQASEAEREGWLVAGKKGRPARVYFTDGESIPAPEGKGLKKVDFVAACRARLERDGRAAGEREGDEAVFRRMQRNAGGAVEESDLVLAAWLHRLGKDDLAALALARSRKAKGGGVGALRKNLAWAAFAGMVHAYMVRADEEALAHGERLFRLYAKEAGEYKQARAVLDDLRRRKKKGTFGKAPPGKWPEGFDKWEAKKKVAYLIDGLDEVDARQWGQPGGVDLGSDRRVAALIDVGDPAVPALIDVIEKDDRLTRSVHFWRDFARSRTVLGVREAALTAVMSILRVRVFEPAATGDNFTARGKDESRKTARRLRAYWKKYGAMPFDERMMSVLTDPKSKPEATREAAYNIAHLGERRTLGTTVFTGGVQGGQRGPNAAVGKFKEPTAAEAILAAMDRDLAAHDAGERDSIHDYRRRGIEDDYLFPLLDLGDRRIAGVLARRCRKAATVRMRRKWALACQVLGDPRPFREFANDFAAGKIVLPPNDRKDTREDDQPGNVELAGIVSYLTGARTPESDRALHALARVTHPHHDLAARRILAANPQWGDESVWFRHPFCLAVLRRALDDTTPTGAAYRIEGDTLKRVEGTGWSSGGLPEILRDPAARKATAAERACDRAAEKLGELLVGRPDYHPLRKDADKRLAELKAYLDRFGGHFRRLGWREADALGVSSFNVAFAPDVRPLGRPATAQDVRAGKAIFHLGGKGRVADLILPAVARVKGGGKEERPRRVLIVQAEAGPDGEVTYGIIGKTAVRAARAGELTDIKPLYKERPKGKKGS